MAVCIDRAVRDGAGGVCRRWEMTMSGQAESREPQPGSDDDAETTRRGQATFTEGADERRQAVADDGRGLAVTEADEAPDDSAPEGGFGSRPD